MVSHCDDPHENQGIYDFDNDKDARETLAKMRKQPSHAWDDLYFDRIDQEEKTTSIV